MRRRTFLKDAALCAAGFVMLKHSRSARSYQANEKLNIALVGVGGRGSWFVGAIPRLGENVVAMCDVNEHKAGPSFERIPSAKKYNDFRKMLHQMDKQIDAVVIAVPDNTHAVACAMAMHMNKHVYCEKPLTHDVYEAGVLRQIAGQRKVATQMGNQGTASKAFRRAVELVQAGVIGQVRQVHVWNTGGGAGERPYPTKEHTIPDYLHWDLWLGPARYRPYNSRWLDWHTWRDFGTGQLGNWASHTMNLPFKALRLDSLWSQETAADRLIKLEPEVSGLHKETFPRWAIVRYDVPARAGLPAVKLNWYNGAGRAPKCREMIEELMGRRLDWGDAGEKAWKDHAGCLLVGSGGMIHANAHNTTFALLPEDKFKDFEGPPPSLPRSRGHEREWMDACRGGPQAMSHFDYATPLTQFVLLGNVATLFGKGFAFDPLAMKIVNMPEANEALKREYRQGWSLE